MKKNPVGGIMKYSVEHIIKNKKTAFKRYQQTKAEQDQRLYREAGKEANKSVAIAKEHAFEELCDTLDSKKVQQLSTSSRRAEREELGI